MFQVLAARQEQVALRVKRPLERPVGLGKVAENLRGDHVDLVTGDFIAVKRRSRPRAVHVAAGCWIVDYDLPPLVVHQLAEIAVNKLGLWDAQVERRGRTLAISLVVKKEETAILAVAELRQDDRATQGSSILVQEVIDAGDPLRIV